MKKESDGEAIRNLSAFIHSSCKRARHELNEDDGLGRKRQWRDNDRWTSNKRWKSDASWGYTGRYYTDDHLPQDDASDETFPYPGGDGQEDHSAPHTAARVAASKAKPKSSSKLVTLRPSTVL